MRSFGGRLRALIDSRGPLCVGIDPSTALLDAWGLGDTPGGLEKFARLAVEAVAGSVAVVKPQSAFFERFGSRGVAVLESVVADARAMGALVIMDAKRGDIGSTTAAYAQAYLHPDSPLAADAVTISPYLGFGSLQPMVDLAREHGAGLFVLARTSNPEAAEVQLATGPDGRTVAGTVMDHVAGLNHGAEPLGSVGVVLGATLTDLDYPVARLNGPILAPGVGAQGATCADTARLFAAARRNVLPSVSRAVLAEGPDPIRLQDAVDRLNDEAREHLSA
ncbi:orotidine 5'-phosphate decarboxylase [Planobispora rosea]|uniref:Orotidine 5'-phosphate decarboxylase n=1 Tax=Planobispora rosea TaxID=35762 RepID=A0A8J3WFG3_PLARO|nr:orotidine-5'-phosphate decarboxylase [Planobispora rosea]GGS94051.1 orotidine 5'-phosphate decarboxylase [Planobispora rosea]GIH87365.1 orotidine 5'-phosphate decarboxylase [Planobispora rosea]